MKLMYYVFTHEAEGEVTVQAYTIEEAWTKLNDRTMSSYGWEFVESYDNIVQDNLEIERYLNTEERSE